MGHGFTEMGVPCTAEALLPKRSAQCMLFGIICGDHGMGNTGCQMQVLVCGVVPIVSDSYIRGMLLPPELPGS